MKKIVFCLAFLFAVPAFCQVYQPVLNGTDFVNPAVQYLYTTVANTQFLVGPESKIGLQVGDLNRTEIYKIQVGLMQQNSDLKAMFQSANDAKNSATAASLAAGSVPLPSLKSGENFIGFGAGQWQSAAAGAVTFARGLGENSVLKATVTTGGGVSLGAGVKF